MAVILVTLMVLFVVAALFAWWWFDIDLSDFVASSVTPVIGLGIIYFYWGPLAWAAGLVLLVIGIFSLWYLIKRRARPVPPHRLKDKPDA